MHFCLANLKPATPLPISSIWLPDADIRTGGSRQASGVRPDARRDQPASAAAADRRHGVVHAPRNARRGGVAVDEGAHAALSTT